MFRRAASAALVATWVALSAVPAAAQTAGGPADPGPTAPSTPGTASGEVGYRERNVWAVYREPPVAVAAPEPGRPRRPARVCLRLPLPNQEAPPTGLGPRTFAEMRALATSTPLDLTPGSFHTLVCYEVGEDLPYLVTIVVWNPADPAAGNGTTIEGVEAFARDLLDTPAAALTTSPPADRQVTGLETWFAAGAPEVPVRSAQAGPLWATAEAVATAMELDPGDGTGVVSCPLVAGATSAVPEAAPACLRHTYVDTDRRTGTVTRTVQVRVRYAVFLTTSDDPTRRPVDDVLGDPTVVALTVREIQTVLR